MAHIVFVIANNSSVPYFTWFAQKATTQREFTFSFIAMCYSLPEMINEMALFGHKAYWVPFDSNRRKKSMVNCLPKLVRLFKEINPDVVHSHLFDDSLPAILAAKLANVKIRVVTKQDTTFHWFYAPRYVIFDKLINKTATHLIAVSEECKEFILKNEKADPSKVKMIHHGVPLVYITNQSEEKKEELINRYSLRGKRVVGTLARLIEWKGYKLLIDAAEIITKKYNDVIFLFAGVGNQKDELQAIVRKKGLESKIIFTGFVERSYVPSLYGIMQVYAHAANFEPFGFVIAEAMLNAVPVVSTKTGSAQDAILHKENGFLVNERTGAAIAEGIEYILQYNPENTIGLKGQKIAKEMYEFNTMWHNHIDLYREVLRRKK